MSLASYEGIDSVVIYGSWVKTLNSSDIDLTIIDNLLTFPEFWK
jgi:predicted nucleotidyltransferase